MLVLAIGRRALAKARGIEAAERVIVVADHSKFGKRALVRACEIEAIDMLITDAPPPPDLAERLEEAGVVVEIANRNA